MQHMTPNTPPFFIREDITAPDGTLVKLFITIYEPSTQPINGVHNLLLNVQRNILLDTVTWFAIGETRVQLTDQHVPMLGAMQVTGGTTIVRHTTEADYASMVAALRTSILEHIEVEHPAAPEVSEADQTAWDLMNAGYEAAEDAEYDSLMDRYDRELAEKEMASLANPDGLGTMDLDDYRARIGLPTLPPFEPGHLKFFDDSSFEHDDIPSARGLNLAYAMIPDDSALATASYEDRKAALEPRPVDLTQEILAKALDTIEAQAAVISAQKAEIDALKAHLPEEGTETVEPPLSEAEQRFMRGLHKWTWMLVYYSDVQRAALANDLEARGMVVIDRRDVPYMNVSLPGAKEE
jgi:predicted NUDIX family NTP pyrophosphohydrolase